MVQGEEQTHRKEERQHVMNADHELKEATEVSA